MSRSKVAAFVGKAGFRYYVDDNTIELQYGKQNLEINKSNVYLLPSTSGQSFAATQIIKITAQHSDAGVDLDYDVKMQMWEESTGVTPKI